MVLVILGLLAGLVVPNIFNKAERAKYDAAKAQIHLLGQSLDQFRLDVGRYPTTQEGLNALMTNPGVDNWRGLYNKKLPNDPWGRPYQYECPGNHGDYDLMSFGKDGTPSGEGVKNWE